MWMVYIWAIDQAGGQHGWISAKFFFALEVRAINMPKNNEANIQPS